MIEMNRIVPVKVRGKMSGSGKLLSNSAVGKNCIRHANNPIQSLCLLVFYLLSPAIHLFTTFTRSAHQLLRVKSVVMDFFLPKFLYWQFFVTPQLPRTSFAGQTIIVTGGNAGLGLEASRHFVNMGAAKVIIACRTISKGENAKISIEESSGRKGVVEIYKLDLANYASVKAFAQQCQALDRIDAIVENAGISVSKFELTEDHESTITTNVVSTFLLALLILPKLRETASKYNVQPRLSIVSSEVHFWNDMQKERQQPRILEYTKEESKAEMGSRDSVSPRSSRSSTAANWPRKSMEVETLRDSQLSQSWSMLV